MTPTILIVPGLGSSGPEHWQTLWGQQHPEFERVAQRDWDTPVCSEWVATLDEAVMQHEPAHVVLVAHSLACATVAIWAKQYRRSIKAALLVAPADTEAADFPEGTTGFALIPMEQLPFQSIVVASTNDPYVTEARAMQLAQAWGSEFVSIGEAGHINSDSGFGEWEEGLTLLKKLW
ncbi:alpha/beta hydrolase [Pontibacter diazotrophicus]|uniref:Alpha/beta hydrolase n=1 Tax=Pontibacter diazotrophicus TaxID=1400979 RepID=A0A3D8LGA3_9BACT|nr:alpha/beta hydrolase [Pontibacter diazotrophicus]RDV16254.1 alpha/beta hydrolase [Pontibacter diazotrophicus]